jgi:MFS family permease
VRFFAAAFLSAYGDWLTTVALVVVLFQLTHNPAGPAGYILVRVAPRALGPWIGGSLADRLQPRWIIVTTASVQAVFTLLLITSNRAGAIWAIFAVVAAAQFAGALSRPSQGAMLPRLVSDRALPRANATYWLFFSSSIFVAPVIGAILLARTGPDLLFAIDAATFAVSAALTATLPSGRAGVALPGTGPAPSSSTLAGVRVALRHPVIRGVAAANFASGIAVTVTQALLVVAAHERYGGDAIVGYLYAGVGVGGTLGGIVALRVTPPRHWVKGAVFLVVVTELVSLAGFAAVSALAAAFALLAVSSLAGSSFDIWGGTEVQRLAPPGYMGRFNSVIWLAQYAGMLVGALWALGTSSIFHWDRAIQIACAAMLVVVTVVVLAAGQSAPAEQREP